MRAFVEGEATNPFLNEKFVPLGCQFMDEKIIQKIDAQLAKLKSTKQAVPKEIKIKDNQKLFAETYPFYIGHSWQTVWDF